MQPVGGMLPTCCPGAQGEGGSEASATAQSLQRGGSCCAMRHQQCDSFGVSQLAAPGSPWVWSPA